MELRHTMSADRTGLDTTNATLNLVSTSVGPIVSTELGQESLITITSCG